MCAILMGLSTSTVFAQANLTLGGGGTSTLGEGAVNGVTNIDAAIADRIRWSNSFYENVNINSGTDINVGGNTRIRGSFKGTAGNKIIFSNSLRVQLNDPGTITVGNGIEVGENFFGFPSRWVINRKQTEVTNHLFEVKGNWYGTNKAIASLEEIGDLDTESNIVITIPSQQWDDGSKNPDGSVGTLTGLTFTIGEKAYGYTRIALPDNVLLGSITDKDGVTQFSPAVVTVKQGSYVSSTDATRNNFAFYGKANVAGSPKVVYLRLVPGTNTEASPEAIYAWGWIYDEGDSDKGAYSDHTSSVLFAPAFAQELGMGAIARRHDRIGQLQLNEGGKTWGRVLSRHQWIHSKQFESSLRVAGLQIGHDIQQRSEASLIRRSGVMLTYQRAWSDLFDRFNVQASPEGLQPRYAQVGEADMHFLGLGVYRTSDYDWGYTDYVGQVYGLKQQFDTSDQKHFQFKGWGVNASAEIGRRLYQKNQWLLQAQGQAVYQWHHYLAQDTDPVKYQNHQQLRLRAGLRLERTADKQRLWFTADVLHDLIRARAVSFGVESLSLKLPRTWLDVGLGADWHIRPRTVLYGALHAEVPLQRYERKRGVRGGIGVKWHF